MRFVLLLLAALLLTLSAPAQQDDRPTTATIRTIQPLFRIGFLRREETGHPGEQQLEQLRNALLADPLIQREFAATGYEGIGLFSCDGAADMLRRLNAREFELAFTPANLYKEQQAGYTAILKARRPKDIIAPPPSDYVRRLGVVIVSPRSPLFSVPEMNAARLRTVMGKDRIAVVSTQSVAGFHAPLLALARRHQLRSFDGGYLWFESSEEVVKAVLSGLAPSGACEAGAVESVLVEAGLVPEGLPPAEFARQRDRYLRVIVESDPVVTDPVVVRRGLAPRGSTLGRAIRQRIRTWSVENRDGDIQYRDTTDDEYRALKALLDEFNTVIGEVPR